MGSAFTSTVSQHGGQETTLIHMHTFFYHQGMVVAGVPYAAQELFNLDEISGGTPYGASTIAGPRASAIVGRRGVRGQKPSLVGYMAGGTMIAVRRASERGHGQHGWLDTYHTFSFNDYYDPRHMGFRVLRVINEDRVEPGQGFGAHGHRDMEILSYVLDGALAHKDSLGNGSVLRPGEFQCMTAGTGIRHSEFNPSDSEPVHFYQIWLLPDRKGLAPSYDQRAFPEKERRGKLRVVASPDGRDGSLTIHQDSEVLLTSLAAGERVTHELAPRRHAWFQVLRGSVRLNGVPLATSDGAAVSDESSLTVLATEPCEVMLFDLP